MEQTKSNLTLLNPGCILGKHKDDFILDFLLDDFIFSVVDCASRISYLLSSSVAESYYLPDNGNCFSTGSSLQRKTG